MIKFGCAFSVISVDQTPDLRNRDYATVMKEQMLSEERKKVPFKLFLYFIDCVNHSYLLNVLPGTFMFYI